MKSLSVKDVAERLNISTARVHQLIQSGFLPAQKIGRDWFILEKDVESAQSRPGRGRPKKTKAFIAK